MLLILIPVLRSTCESFCGRLLAIGGSDYYLGKPTTAVYMYNLTTNFWQIISHMTTDCSTAVLPDNKLMVVGGYIGMTDKDLVELATMCDD